MLPELRLKALWAFKNLAFGCEPQLQQQLLQELGWGVFSELLTRDDDVGVRAQAVGLLQNLCKGGDSIEQVRACCHMVLALGLQQAPCCCSKAGVHLVGVCVVHGVCSRLGVQCFSHTVFTARIREMFL
jgi:hypothetical protein